MFFKSNTFHWIDNVEQCVIYRENCMGILDLWSIQPCERKHFLDKRDHPGSFLLNIQQMFIVPAYFRREKFGIGTDDGEWGFQFMTGIGNKFFLG